MEDQAQESDRILSEAERTRIAGKFHQTQVELIEILASVSEEIFQQKSKPESWSISEIMEHMINVEAGVISTIKKLGFSAKGSPMENPPSEEKVLAQSSNREVRVSAPQSLIPKGVFANKASAIEAFTQHRKSVEEFVQINQLNLRSISFPHPRLGMYDGVNWLFFLIGHSQRHIEQAKSSIEELSEE